VYQTISGTGVFDYYSVNSTCWVSPIVLDLSHTGKLDASEGNWLPHTGIKGNKVLMFDINGNGLKMMMEWVGPNAGLLIEPKANGTVDGSCLFGTAGGFNNGYQKLGLRDKNNDGQLTGAELTGLLVWQDKNQNGTIENGELKNLADLKITQLSLKQNKFKSSFVMNGKTETMWDWWPTALDVRKVAVFEKK
jgi:hypothetical protein